MGYSLCDERGFLAPGPSITGLRKLRLAASGPAARRFFAQGWTTDLAALAQELAAWTSDDAGVARSLRELRTALAQARFILILTDDIG